MKVHTPRTPSELLPPSEVKDARRAAMLSVYYHSLGRRLELRGAPAVLLPPDVEPVPLGEALETLRPDPAQFRAAIWTIARGIAPQAGDDEIRLSRYPPELVEIVTSARKRGRLLEFERKRREYLRDAHRLGEVLTEYAYTKISANEFRKRIDALEPHRFSKAIAAVGALGSLDGTPSDVKQFLEHLASKKPKSRKKAARALRRLSDEVGLPLTTVMEEFSSAVAFEEEFPQRKTLPGRPQPMTIFPTSSVTVQDARSLITTVTVTAMIRTKNFRTLCVSLDPQCWMTCSHAFKDSSYLDPDDFESRPRDPDDVGTSFIKPPSRLLREHVRIVWGLGKEDLGEFHNILNTTFVVRDKYPASIDLEFDLHRCLSSRILWDVRPGGILIDQGYAKARQIADDLFRVTVRKTLRFSDRTPNSGGPGWHDLGEVLNFLAPAAMSWWLESEMYNQSCPEILKLARPISIPAPRVPEAELPMTLRGDANVPS